MENKQKFYETKIFAIISILFGSIGILLLMHHIISYEYILRPYMDYLIANKVITNNINGATFLFFFTNQSNVLVDVFMILYGIGLLGNKKLYQFTHKDGIRGAVTLYIFVTGLIYCGVLLPFAKASFPMEKGIWFSNVVNVWAHMVVPVCFTAFWFCPLQSDKIPIIKTALLFLIFPLVYFIFSVIRGAIVHFYPYPFLNSHQLWQNLFADKAYQTTPAIFLLIGVIVAMCGIFFGLGCGLCAIHNRLIQKSESNTQQPLTEGDQ